MATLDRADAFGDGDWIYLGNGVGKRLSGSLPPGARTDIMQK